MPQVLKDDVRQKIVASALEVFAECGYEGATNAAIAARAGVAAAGIYRYFPSKTELFEAVVTPELAERFEALLAMRVRSLASLARPGAEVAGPGGFGEEMLRFWIDHRLAVVILLDRAHATPYAAYGERFVEQLVTLTLAQMRATSPGLRLSRASRAVLGHIFENTRRTIAAVLVENTTERGIREGIEAFWSYQLPGVQGFVRWAVAQGR
jgi:AcrR family transcriptional regulator